MSNIIIALRTCHAYTLVVLILLLAIFSCNSPREKLLDNLNAISLDLTSLVNHLNALNVDNSSTTTQIVPVLSKINEHITILTSVVESDNSVTDDDQIVEQLKNHYVPALKLILKQTSDFIAYVDGLILDKKSDNWLAYNSKASKIEVDLHNFIAFHNDLIKQLTGKQ